MRRIELHLPEAAAREALRKLEGFPSLVSLSATACEHPRGQWLLTLVVSEPAYPQAVSLIEESGAFSHGVLIASRVDEVQGAEPRGAEPLSPVWEERLRLLAQEGAPTPRFLLLVALGSLIALCGLVTGSIPLLVGAMLIPPPLNALLLVPIAVLQRQPRVLLEAFLTLVLALALAIGVAWAASHVLFTFSVVPNADSFFAAELLQERSRVGLYAFLVALAAGIAGGVSVVANRPIPLVGVMIAVALLPSAATLGHGLAQEDADLIWGAWQLLGSNLALLVLGAWGALLALRILRR